ncbi:MAG: ATP-binding cassette domain-containing protein [Limisphaerales bacterium]
MNTNFRGLTPRPCAVKLRAQVGYLAEDQVMYGWMTPIELCRFLAPFYPTWDMDFARSYLERFDIPLHSKIRHLSKGQSIKLGLAVALAHRPPIVILDDPAMGLDPIARKEFNRDLVEHLQTSGCTVLYSSHLLGEVEAVADAVAILDEGKILRTGTTDQLREEVKRIILPIAEVSGLPKPDGLLDVRQHEQRLALVTDHADIYTRQLAAGGIDHEVVELSLDEIFEAFVIGRTVDWPDKSARPAAISI